MLAICKRKFPVPNSDGLPPVGSFVHIKWLESGNEQPGWYRAQVDKYLLNGCCKVIYDDDSDSVVFKEIDLHQVEWKPCSRRARKFVPLSR